MFQEFLKGMSFLSPKAELDSKLYCLFILFLNMKNEKFNYFFIGYFI